MKQVWQEKWIADCKLQGDDLIDWTAVYLSPFKCTKLTKLIMFHFKLLHRRPATNSFFKKIGIKETDLCTFCKSEVESLIHLFCNSRVISQFWQGFRQWMIINQEFVENELTPTTRRPPVLLFLLDFLFGYAKQRKSLLKWEISNLLHPLNVPHASVNLVSPTSIAR